MRWFGLLIAVGLQLPAHAAAQEIGDAAAGAAYAQKICAECHAVLSGQGYSPNPDAPTFETIAETHGMSERAIVVWLLSSHPNMPNIMVEANDRENLAAYIMGLKAKR